MFAIRAIDRLFEVIREINPEVKRTSDDKHFSAELTGALVCVRDSLVHMSSESMGEAEDALVKNLLDDLEELLCKPGPRAVQNHHPSLQLLLKDRRPAKARLRFYITKSRFSVKGRRGRATLLRKLTSFANQINTQREEAEISLARARHVRTQAPPSHSTSMQTLYQVLATYATCSNAGIPTHLRLKTMKSQKFVDGLALSVLFLAHPHGTNNFSGAEWSYTIIDMATIDRDIGRNSDQTFGTTSDPGAPGRQLKPDGFCEDLLRAHAYPLPLLLNGQSLSIYTPSELYSSNAWISSSPSLSLENILELKSPPERLRCVLAFFIVRAFWCFYGTGWMSSPWTAQTIHFMAERRQKMVGVFLNEPFLVSPFETGIPRDGVPDVSPLTHIKCLGVLLLQVALGKTLSLLALENAPEIPLHGGLQFFQQIYVANVVLKDKSQTLDIPTEFLNVIIACMQPDTTFKPYLGINNVGGLRMAIWRNLAAPLQDFVQGNWGKHPDVMEVILPTVTRDEIGNPAAGWANAPTAYSGHVFTVVSQNSHQRHGGGTTFESSTMASSKSWFTELDDLITILGYNQTQNTLRPLYKPVSIAIIDTGISSTSTASHRVREYRDFVCPGSGVRLDETGHGTNGAELLVRVFPGVELYVARVWKTNIESSNTRALMVEVSIEIIQISIDNQDLVYVLNDSQAIQCARRDWGVDIISIASGFHDIDDEIHHEIMEAAKDRVLMFAAASNYGNMHNIAFPARMKHQVFGVFATDARANIASSSASINPQPDPNNHNFAILGEEITINPFSAPVSGTSYSTAIAAGIAGQILDFSRQPDSQQQIRKAHKLKSIEGMAAILTLMTLGKGPHGYTCVTPRRLIENYRGADREEMRARLCHKISEALESL